MVKAILLLSIGALLGGGGAYAGQVITSSQIKNGTIQLADLSPSVRSILRISGPQGEPGTDGAQGTQGLPGAPGASGISGLEIVKSGVGTASATATCPAGKLAIGGGFSIGASAAAASYPSADMQSWNVVSATLATIVQAYAVCAYVS